HVPGPEGASDDLVRPEPPYYVGATRPGTVGWSRIGVTAVAGVLLTVLLARRAEGATPVVMLLFGVLFGLLALWTWMGQWTQIGVDHRGAAVGLGGVPPPTRL